MWQQTEWSRFSDSTPAVIFFTCSYVCQNVLTSSRVVVEVVSTYSVIRKFMEQDCPTVLRHCLDKYEQKRSILCKKKSFYIAQYPVRWTHRRTGQHPFGGADRVLPEWIQWGGGSINFPGSIFCGVAEFFPLAAVTNPKFVFFSPLTAVTDPKFVLFKHVLCFARIMSTLCPNSCRQTARMGGGSCPHAPPPPSRTPMVGPLKALYTFLCAHILFPFR